ncbi:MAG: RNA pseudouridine synthase [Treponema sp.]|jgi:23S rRNA pseudouridine1911/1915/1917 synthase|nr:RNA pseudouridine synthase [Treponema sp.]
MQQKDCQSPRIFAETEDYAALYKPPHLHTAPLEKNSGTVNLLEWFAGYFPQVMDIQGRKAREGGLLHRLDFETSGLVLVCKHQKAMDAFLGLQEGGGILKKYDAACGPQRIIPEDNSGFPPLPCSLEAIAENIAEFLKDGGAVQNLQFSAEPELRRQASKNACSVEDPGFSIESLFRPWGRGRRLVRPLPDGGKKPQREAASDRGNPYRTEVRKISAAEFQPGEKRLKLCIELRRGFRHQIRCHLAWLGFPIVNDPLYGNAGAGQGALALSASGLSFTDPLTGEKREYHLSLFQNPVGFGTASFITGLNYRPYFLISPAR